MADISKIKLPNNASYDVKDKNAGRSIALNIRNLLLKNAAGTTISSVELPATKVKLVDSGDTFGYGGFHKSDMYGSSQNFNPTITEKILYLVDEENDRLINKIAKVDPTEISCSGMKATATSNMSIAAGQAAKGGFYPGYSNVTYSGASAIYASIGREIYKNLKYTQGNVYINSSDKVLAIYDMNNDLNVIVINPTSASASFSGYNDYNADFSLRLASAFEDITNANETQYIYDLRDNYNPWDMSWTYFDFYIGGLGSHDVTSIEVKKWDDTTIAWSNVTAVSYTQASDGKVSLTITTGDASKSPTRDLVKLIVHTSGGDSSLIISPNCKIYT